MSGKRPYRMGKRQAAVDTTKRRILEAAVVEYSKNGIDETSMLAVARQADVAPGTVLYHYPDPDDLAEAVVETWVTDMQAPSPEAIDPQAPLEERVGRLVEELFGLYERSEVAYRIYVKSPNNPVLKKYEIWWNENVGLMTARALGDRAGDEEAMKVISVLTNPGFRGTLLMTGIGPERAIEVATTLAVSWLAGPG